MYLDSSNPDTQITAILDKPYQLFANLGDITRESRIDACGVV